jgi:hypothetical protein
LKFDPVLLKPTTNARQATTTNLPPFSVDCDSVEMLATMVWESVQGHVSGLAQQENGTWIMSVEAKSVENVGLFVAIDRSSRKYAFSNDGTSYPASAFSAL